MLWLFALLLLPLALTSPHLAPVISPIQDIGRFWYRYIGASLRKNSLASFFTYYINKLTCSKKCRAKLWKSFYKSSLGKTLTKFIPNMFSGLFPKSVRVFFIKTWASLIAYFPKDMQKWLSGGGPWFYFALFCHIRVFYQVVTFLWGVRKAYQERQAKNAYVNYKRSRAHASAYEAANASGGRHREPVREPVYNSRQERYALNPVPPPTPRQPPTPREQPIISRQAVPVPVPNPIKYETVSRTSEQRAAPVPKPIRIRDPVPVPPTPTSAHVTTPLRTPAFVPTPTGPIPGLTPAPAPAPEKVSTPSPKPRGRPRLTPQPIYQSIEKDPEWGSSSSASKPKAKPKKAAAATAGSGTTPGKRPRGRPRKNPL